FANTETLSLWIVTKKRILVIIIEHIQPETIDTFIQPVTEDIQHSGTHFGIAPVQIRLVLMEHMIIILTATLIELPGIPTKYGSPVVVLAASWGRISPDVPVMIGIVFGFTGFLEPTMLVGRVA